MNYEVEIILVELLSQHDVNLPHLLHITLSYSFHNIHFLTGIRLFSLVLKH